MFPPTTNTSSITMASPKNFTIQVKSEGRRESGDSPTEGSASVIMNSTSIFEVDGKYPAKRGLYVAFFNEHDGSYLGKEHFKAYKHSDKNEDEGERFKRYIKSIPVGSLVAVAVCGECPAFLLNCNRTSTSRQSRKQKAEKIAKDARLIFEMNKLGSKLLNPKNQLEKYASWVLISYKQKGVNNTLKKELEIIKEGLPNKNSTQLKEIFEKDSPAYWEFTNKKLQKYFNMSGISVRVSLTEDYYKSDTTPYKFYRAIISFPIGTTEAQFTAVQDIEVEIDGKRYALNPVKPLTVPTNTFGKMVLITKATKLNIPAINVCTSEMSKDESYIIALNSQAYHKIANLETGAIAKNRKELKIDENYSDEQCNHVQCVVTLLASAYQPTYNYLEGANGVYHDRYIRPHNMEHLHWKYSPKSGVTPLQPKDVVRETEKAKLVQSAGQSFWDDIGDAFNTAEEIVVHTVKRTALTAIKQGKNVINTVEHMATDAENTISHIAEDEYKGIVKTGNDLVHGNISGAFSDVIHMESAVVSDVFTGGENIVSHAVEGTENALVITFKAAEEDVQYILKHTGELGKAIEGCLGKVKLEAENLLAWLAEELGWDDILKVQKYIERVFNDSIDKIPSIINNLRDQIDAAFKIIKTDLHSNIQQARKYFGANPNLIHQSADDHDPAALDKAHEHTDWLMSKVISDSDSSVFAVPDPSKNLLDQMTKLIQDLSHKVENDRNLKSAVENLQQDFTGLFQGSVLDIPSKLILIVLDLAEIIADVAIDIINVLVDALLDCFRDLIKWFQEMVNTPIELPFITDIYKKLTNGEQLTILSFTSLVIAIPAKFIAEFFEESLASMTPSASQALTSTQIGFGYVYSASQLMNGVLNMILDTKPPKAILKMTRVEMQPLINGRRANLPQPGNFRAIVSQENRYNQISRFFPLLTKITSINSCIAQFFGNPSGDWEFYRGAKPDENAEAFAWMRIIWLYQLIKLLIMDLFIQNCAKIRPEDDDILLGLQGGYEILHLLFFWYYNCLDNGRPWEKKWSLFNYAYLFDPMMGIVQLGRLTPIIEATEGGSYLAVPVTDFYCQSSYALVYALGIYSES